MEPDVGFEPTTDGLQNRCSTPELIWHKCGKRVILTMPFEKFKRDFHLVKKNQRSTSKCGSIKPKTIREFLWLIARQKST